MAKINPADAEAARLMEIQRAAAPKSRRGDIGLIVVCAVLILAFGVGIYCIPHRDFSEVENTTLQTFPRASSSGKFLDQVWNGKFMAALKEFYTDQFPFRDQMVAAKAGVELALGKGENNAVILGKDGYLIKRIEYSEDELDKLRANLAAVSDFRVTVGKPVTFALAPRAIDVLGTYLPGICSADRAEAVWKIVDTYADGSFGDQPTLLSLREVLEPLADAGEPVWYRTDHHWTTLGAYHAYAALGELCGYMPAAQDSFIQELAAADFLGTTYSASGFYWVDGEEMYFWRYPGDETYTVEILANDEVIQTLKGFYDRSYLEKKDKYAAFLSSNNAHMRVSNGEDKPTLLLIKDSFAHSVVPFLAQHYTLEILDLRYYRKTVASFLETHEVDRILILCGLDSLATSDLLTALPVGMGE